MINPSEQCPSSHEEPIGFVGLGHMGTAMALRLLQAGFQLVVHDTNPLNTRALAAAGARAAADSADVGNSCGMVFLCLPSPAASSEVCRAMAGTRALRLVVETSTVGPQAIAELQALLGSAVSVLDAPVSGGPSGAAAGTLAVMYAGTPSSIASARQALEAIAGRSFHVGDSPGLAQVCKLVNNAISAAGMIAACEALLVGVKAGLHAQTLVDAVNASSGRNAATQDKFPRAILPGTFDYGGPLGLMLKDLTLFNQQAEALGVQNTMAPTTLAAWEEAVRRSGPQADYSEVIRHMETDSGVEVRASERNDIQQGSKK